MKQTLFFTLFFLSLAGCQAPQKTPPPPPTPEQILLSKVDLPRFDLQIETIRAGIGPTSKLMEVHIIFQNLAKSDTPYRYKTVWFTEDGTPLTGADSGWRGITMNRGSNPLRLLARDDRAADFKITVEKEK